MSATRQKCGPHAVAIYIDNAQGRRLLVVEREGDLFRIYAEIARSAS